jgi:hypothetical protein
MRFVLAAVSTAALLAGWVAPAGADVWTSSAEYSGCFEANTATPSAYEYECHTDAIVYPEVPSLYATAAWTSLTTLPDYAYFNEARAGARVTRTASIKHPGQSLTFTARFTAGLYGLSATHVGAGASALSGYVLVGYPGCKGSCDQERASVTLVRADAANPQAEIPGGTAFTVSLTLTASPGERLPSGRYTIHQQLHATSQGPRLPRTWGNTDGWVIPEGVAVASSP